MPTKFKTSLAANRQRVLEVFNRLHAEYPDAKCSLDYRNPLELMVATILSAQCTDERVNVVTKDLFKHFKKPEDYVDKPREQIEKTIQSCGFYRQKAKSIANACEQIIQKHGGKVPRDLNALTKLAGVGRKTANVILGNAYGIPGITVDTHCGRVSRRLAFTANTDPVKVEMDLQKVWPQEHWTLYSHLLIYHGRAICQSRAPKCSQCVVRDLCPFPDTREGKKIAR
ncbi:MAG: endonuclease III [Candidatus Hydrogenedentales bacterium]